MGHGRAGAGSPDRHRHSGPARPARADLRILHPPCSRPWLSGQGSSVPRAESRAGVGSTGLVRPLRGTRAHRSGHLPELASGGVLASAGSTSDGGSGGGEEDAVARRAGVGDGEEVSTLLLCVGSAVRLYRLVAWATMTQLGHYLRRMWRAALTPDSLLAAEEAVEALPAPGPEARAWLLANVEPAGEVAGVAVYRWGNVVAATGSQRTTVPQPGTASDLLTTAEVAELLRVPVSRIHTWTAEGKLPHMKLGHRTVRYRRDDALAFARQAVVAGTGARDADPQEGRRVLRRLSIHRPPDRPVEALEAFDWTRHHQKGG